jgi:hypothetical protein
MIADHMKAAVNPHRLRFYLLTLFFEWLLFVFVSVGVRWGGAPARLILGDRWRSVRQVLRDIVIAAAFWIVSAGLLLVLGWLLRVAGHRPSMEFILPHGEAEITVWIALSITADICEENVFRGYLQRQFMALTTSVPLRVSVLPDGYSDRPVRRNVLDSGSLARKRSPWNDRPCVAGFIERSPCGIIEALGHGYTGTKGVFRERRWCASITFIRGLRASAIHLPLI